MVSRKITAVILCFAMIIGMTGCKEKSKDKEQDAIDYNNAGKAYWKDCENLQEGDTYKIIWVKKDSNYIILCHIISLLLLY